LLLLWAILLLLSPDGIAKETVGAIIYSINLFSKTGTAFCGERIITDSLVKSSGAPY
jgi:hypothetical protein